MDADWWGSILVTYTSSDDDAVLAHAVALAQAHRARLAVAVPIARARCAPLTFVDLIGLHVELERTAQRLAAQAARLVPDDVSLVIRCVPPEHVQRLACEIAAGGWDLCVASQRAARTRRRGGGLERLVLRSARRSGVATVLAPVAVA
ncbi:MAG: hypothetical protein JSS99_08485 [Actinobacteria bacterium]|nr:hypothetical protein [Actinomycetota bacterium]